MDKNINVYLSTFRQKGYLAYEYNPFYNYLTNEDLYIINDKFIVPKGLAVNIKNGEILTLKGNKWVDKYNKIVDNNDLIKAEESNNSKLYAKAGSLIDFETDKLNFDLEHPVDITVLPSYDGSVNLILNDNKNTPRLINSRFSVREKNTYEIVDRIGENDTNIYNSETFDKDTSLYFLYEDNPTISYEGFIKGILPVGQYCFYFTYCDSDENESDYIAESGLIPVFIGSNRSPLSMDGGIKNLTTNKGIKLKLSNVDKSYNYLKIYYVRYFADYQLNRVYECKKIYRKYPINSNILQLQITGNEEAEDIDANILNISRFNAKSVLTQALCKNILFFGNIVKNTDNYKELQDCALRIIPTIESKILNNINNEYNSSNNSDFGYYDSINIYNNVGYFDLEYYRFGVVFIYNNGTLSNVYNTLGTTLYEESLKYIENSLFKESEVKHLLKRQYVEIDDFGWIKNVGEFIESPSGEFNAKGVCKLNYSVKDDNTILGIKFKIPEEVINYLKEDLGIRGLFFVRLKCVPNILAQCYLMPMDEVLEAPIILYEKNKYRTECFLSLNNNVTTNNSLLSRFRKKNESNGEAGLVINSYKDRLYEYKRVENESSISKNAYAAICPDFLLNLPYYNLIFNGSKFKLERITERIPLLNDSSNPRYYIEKYDNKLNSIKYINGENSNSVTINSVTDDVPTIAINDKIFRLEIGETEESFRFGFAEFNKGNYNVGDENSIKEALESYNLVRGKYSPYLAIYSNNQLVTGALYNIYLDGMEDVKQEFQNRMDSSEPFYAISDRFNFDNIELRNKNKVLTCWRGDCYINTFTYRLNRNFNDPSLPNNDEIIDNNTWKDNYDLLDQSKWANISRSDINAVQMGSWITFKLRSSMNYALRSQDHSYVAEEALMGSPRSFYPRSKLMYRGENKMPDSYLYNDAYRASLGFKCYFTLQDINYIKDTFSNRIQYSDISVQDSFKNNYRVSLSTYFRDYSQEYGGIIKLVGFEGYLLVIFEHAIAIAVINERVLAGEGDGEPVFINTHNVLPEELTIITDTYGTLWGDSVVKSESGYVYGVDTIAKKIWRVKGQQIEILSDFKVNKFLIDNISFNERELYPIIGLKNIKSHYNNNKKDIMFTFYDDIYKDEEKVWNLCYNELLGEFITFYSWVPSFSENIDTKFFTFDRNTAKGLALLEKCNYSIPENTGVLVDNPVIELSENVLAEFYYKVPKLVTIKIINNEYKEYEESTEISGITFKFERDHWRNNELFVFDNNQLKISEYGNKISPENGKTNIVNAFEKLKILYLEITPNLSEPSNILDDTVKNTLFKTETIALTLKEYINNPNLTNEDVKKPFLTTDFYIHGTGGIFDIRKNIYPCKWYEKLHPFEFEFVVNDNIALLKIFNNLILISNKAEPDSFHFEIEGDNYEFSSDKRTMYFRQEATKNLYLNLGSNILYDRSFKDCISEDYTKLQYYRLGNEYLTPDIKLVRQVKSTIFPLYYERVKTYNDIYNSYFPMIHPDYYNFLYLSGSEIKWNRDLNQFSIITHIKNSPIDQVGILKGNSLYKEGKWNILIPSISFMLKNEDDWVTIGDNDNLEKVDYKIPPIVINSSYIPNDLKTTIIDKSKLPSIYLNGNYNWPRSIDNKDWTYRKETKIRDKWIKIRIRYTGENLAIIHSLVTLYNISYS